MESATLKHDLADLISSRIRRESERLHTQFASQNQVRTRHCIVDDLLPDDIARKIFASFPPLETMRLMSSFREKKYTTKAVDKAAPIVADVTFAFQDPRVISAVEEITGMKAQRPDSNLYAGGLSVMTKGHFLHPHLDNSHDSERKLYRTLNLLYYVSPDWSAENGANLELWDEKVANRVSIPSLFNRLVIMETNRYSWHSVSDVAVKRGRACVSNYYFSEYSPDGFDYFHVTSFSAPPEKPLVRAVSAIDNVARMFVRKLKPQGVGKRDLFSGPKGN